MRGITQKHGVARWRPMVAAAVIAAAAIAVLIVPASAMSFGDEHAAEPVEATVQGHVAIQVLMHLLESDLVPPEAASVLQGLVNEHRALHSTRGDVRSEGRGNAQSGAGVICRRAAEHPGANPEITERCRAWVASQSEVSESQERPSRAEICRRTVENPDADPKLTRACRAWMATLGDGGALNPSEVCRRLASSEQHSRLTAEVRERCAAWIESQSEPVERPSRREICERALENPEADPRLTKACRVWLGLSGDANQLRERGLESRERIEVLREQARSLAPAFRASVTVEE